MREQVKPKFRGHILTIPNILSMVRLCLIPVFVWLYCVKQDDVWTAAVLVLSGLTDLADGFIARHFHMVSDLGKILDPIADKLTQAAMLYCLLTRFPLMLLPLGLLVLKEIAEGATGLLVIKRTGRVIGADWHGKAATCLLYAMMILHLLWFDIPARASHLAIALTVAMMAVSFALYLLQNVRTLRAAKE